MNSWLAAFLSAICFALMSLFVKLSLNAGVSVIDLTFFRFAIGSVFLITYFLLTKNKFQVNSWKFSLVRAFSNIIAVSLFYWSFNYLDLGTANLLNLTYPIFIAVLAPFVLKETSSWQSITAVILSSIGISLLFVDLSSLEYQKGLFIGLTCGFVSALTIMSLKQARKFDSSITIVSVLMILGTISLAPFFSFTFPSAWLWVLLASILALSGQLFITYSFKGLTSIQGSIMSSARIVVTYALGIFFLADPLKWEFIVASILVSLAIYISKLRTKN